MDFEPSAGPTVGVEWELQLLDPITLDLVDGIMPLMEFFPRAERVKPEYIQSCVELTTRVCNDSAEAIADISGTLTKALQRCKELEMGLCGAGTHPFCRRLALITPLPRYKRIAANTGILSHTQITFSTHVHVGMSSGDEAMHAMSLLIPAVPVFIAMSANSPFWRGHETGHAAYRHRILAAAPNYGLPERFADWQQFKRFIGAAERCGMIETFKDIHWDIRPHPDFGTLELRTMDSVSDSKRLLALVAFVRSLVLRLANTSVAEAATLLPLNLPRWAEKQNRYRAAHSGLDAEFIVNASGEHRPLRDLAADLIDFSRATAAQYGETTGLALASELLTQKPDYQRQREAFDRAKLLPNVVSELQCELLDGCAEMDKLHPNVALQNNVG
ncbi:MAG: YbdK family carboxylate-amine ligase [Gammaproteobacteria bacterium]|nr:YbdK family carboxylate-amine ligase [Gammaproteobacteria bacterium]